MKELRAVLLLAEKIGKKCGPDQRGTTVFERAVCHAALLSLLGGLADCESWNDFCKAHKRAAAAEEYGEIASDDWDREGRRIRGLIDDESLPMNYLRAVVLVAEDIDQNKPYLIAEQGRSPIDLAVMLAAQVSLSGELFECRNLAELTDAVGVANVMHTTDALTVEDTNREVLRIHRMIDPNWNFRSADYAGTDSSMN